RLPSMNDAHSRLREAGKRIGHVVIPDLDASLRGRRLRLDDIATTFETSGTFVNVLHKWDTAEQVTGSPPFVGEPVVLDWTSVRDWPFEQDSFIVFADYDGPSRALSPRQVLATQVARAADAGYAVRAAMEFEFHVLKETAESLRMNGFGDPVELFAADNRCWGSQSAAIHSDYVTSLESLVCEAGIDLFSLGLELGPGCFEATLQAGDPLKAADDAVLFKTLTKAHARRQGMTASFMAQLGASHPGLSGHVHLSLADSATGKALFHDAAAADAMSATMRQAVAGVVGLTGDFTAMVAHTVNAYRRLAPGNWAPKTATWAVENYAAAVRALAPPENQARIEFRLPGADTNPYLAIAATLGAALHGIKRNMDLPAPITGGGPDDTPPGVPRLARSLAEAAERLDASKAARAIFGDTFIDHFVATRFHEDARLRRHVSAGERERYLEVV
ncbi:MAG: glutamine synthetase, partial [bacterium]|nr:glutamine synthetase [bacterium]